MGLLLVTGALLAVILTTHVYYNHENIRWSTSSNTKESSFFKLFRSGSIRKDNRDTRLSFSLNSSQPKSTEEGNQKLKTCSSDECITLATLLKTNMNENINPCDDFYEFSCGNYKKQNPIPNSKNEVNELEKISDQLNLQIQQLLKEPIDIKENRQFQILKSYYKICMDEDTIEKNGLTKAKEIIDYLGGWPVLNSNVEESDWTEIIYRLSDVGISPNYVMTLHVDNDYLNSSIRRLELAQPSFPLGRESVSLGRESKNVGFYYDYMVKVSLLFGADREMAMKDMGDALDFEISLAKISKPLVEILANITATYNVYTIKEMSESFSGFPWMDYLATLTPPSTGINEDSKLILTEPKYLEDLAKILAKTPKKVVANYLIWRFVNEVGKYLNKDLLSLQNKFVGSVLGNTESTPRAIQCVKTIEEMLDVILSAMYVREYFDKESRSIASDLTTHIQEEFRQILLRTSWLEEDKQTAVEKVDALVQQIGFPDELLDDAKLDSVYKDLKIDSFDFLLSSLDIQKFKRDFKFKRLNEVVNKTDWIDNSFSATVNAFYKVESNSIILPAAILQGIFFNANRPSFANYGAIGFVIGHEITHGFDSIGHLFNKNGDLNNWWSKTAEEDFKSKRSCLVEQYSEFKVQDREVDGDLTVNENTADYGGLKTSYLTWSKMNGSEGGLPGLPYDSRQLFWISAANIWCNNIKPESERFKLLSDSHAPNRFRVNGPVMNLEMFSEDFKCPLGSKMNPSKKCTPW